MSRFTVKPRIPTMLAMCELSKPIWHGYHCDRDEHCLRFRSKPVEAPREQFYFKPTDPGEHCKQFMPIYHWENTLPLKRLEE